MLILMVPVAAFLVAVKDTPRKGKTPEQVLLPELSGGAVRHTWRAIAFDPLTPLRVYVMVPVLLSVNASVIVPTFVAGLVPFQVVVGIEPPVTLYRLPWQPLPLTAQLDATYQVGLPVPSYTYIAIKNTSYC